LFVNIAYNNLPTNILWSYWPIYMGYA